MSLKNRLSGITAQLEGATETERPLTKVRGTGTVGAPVQLAQYSVAYQELERKVEELSASQGKPMRVALELCDDGDHHASPINESNVEVLKANLAHNPQVTPAVLLRKPDGRYEIISGRHRKRALLALGRTEWDAVIREPGADFLASKDSFFDNLLARKLTDFETFLGFKRLKLEANYTYEQMAKEAHRPKSSVYAYFVFDDLEGPVLEAVIANQRVVSNAVMEALHPFVARKPEAVVEAISALAANPATTISQLVSRLKDAPAKEKASAKEVVVKAGKKQYATISLKGNRCTITLKGPAEQEAAQILEDLEKLMKQRAERAK